MRRLIVMLSIVFMLSGCATGLNLATLPVDNLADMDEEQATELVIDVAIDVLDIAWWLLIF